MHVFRVGALFNRRNKTKGIDQKGIFDISRAKGYRDYVLTDPDNPLIPGTNVERLRLVHLGPKAAGVSDDEIRRVVAGLEDWYATKAAAQRATGRPENFDRGSQFSEGEMARVGHACLDAQ